MAENIQMDQIRTQGDNEVEVIEMVQHVDPKPEDESIGHVSDDDGESDGEKESGCKAFCTGLALITSLLVALIVVFSPVIIAYIVQHRLQPGTVYVKTDLGNKILRANQLHHYNINHTTSGCLKNVSVSAEPGKNEKYIGYLWRNQTKDLSEEKLQEFKAFVIIDDKFSSPMPNLEKFINTPTVKIHMRDFEEIKMLTSSKLLMTAKGEIKEEPFPSELRCGACDRCTRSGHGTCSTEGKCTCVKHRFGEDCSVYCSPDFTCGGQGTCNPRDGSCICRKNYFGPGCSVYCSPDFTCGGQGTCNPSNGICSCKKGYFGPSCSECNCSPNGSTNNSCNSSGKCVCKEGFFGQKCDKIEGCDSNSYHTLTDETRRSSYGYGRYCDRSVVPNGDTTSPDWKGAGWYRVGNNRSITSQVVPYRHCNTYFPGYLARESRHPDEEGKTIPAKICFNGYGYSCWREMQIQIKRCKGFHLYHLPKVPECNCCRICTT